MITSLETCIPHIAKRCETIDAFSSSIGIMPDVLMQLNPHIRGIDVLQPGIPLNLPFECLANANDKSADSLDEELPPLHWAVMEWEANLVSFKGPNASNSAIEKYDASTGGVRPDDIDWCSSFVNWCVEQAGLQGTDNSAARSWENWQEETATPKRGDIVVFKRKDEPWRGHVGFYWSDAGDFVQLLGANQTNSIQVSHYPKNGDVYEVLGFRRVPGSSKDEAS